MSSRWVWFLYSTVHELSSRYEKNSWQSRDSNPGLLGENSERYLCAIQPPFVSRLKYVNLSVTRTRSGGYPILRILATLSANFRACLQTNSIQSNKSSSEEGLRPTSTQFVTLSRRSSSLSSHEGQLRRRLWKAGLVGLELGTSWSAWSHTPPYRNPCKLFVALVAEKFGWGKGSLRQNTNNSGKA